LGPDEKQSQGTAEPNCEEKLRFICIPVVDEQAGSGGYRDVSGRLKWIEGSIEGWKESRMLQKKEKRQKLK